MTAPLTSQPRSPKTLLERLSPRVASIRASVHGRVGTHAYRVFLVHTSWSGGEPGRGTKTTDRHELGCGKHDGRIVPPSVQDAIGLNLQLRAELHGLGESGTVIVREVSDYLLTELGIADFASLAANEASYFEIVQDDRDGTGPKPVRAMVLDGTPQHDVQGCQWILVLRAAHGLSSQVGGTP